MQKAGSFKRNAGKRIGSYNLARCRSITDRSDCILGAVLGLSAVWREVELTVEQVVKTDFGVKKRGRRRSQPVPGSIALSDS